MSFKKHLSLLEEALPKDQSILVFDSLSKKLAQDIVESANKNKIILIFGNGGSATDSSHWSSELVASYENRKRRVLPVLSLSESLSTITAVANDTSYENVFKRQVDAYGNLSKRFVLCIQNIRKRDRLLLHSREIYLPFHHGAIYKYIFLLPEM